MPLWGERHLIPLLFRAITEEREAEMEKKVHCELPGKNRARLWRGLAGGSLAIETVCQVGNGQAHPELTTSRRGPHRHWWGHIQLGVQTRSGISWLAMQSRSPHFSIGALLRRSGRLIFFFRVYRAESFLLKEFWWNGIQLRLLQAVGSARLTGWIAIGLCSSTNVNKSVFRRKRNVGDCFSHQNISM